LDYNGDLVTIIIAAYNAERTIANAVRSALSQTHRNLEIIVCDDASTDNTIGAIKAFSDGRIKLLENRCNKGPGPTRDRAIQHSSGKWVTFLDADDQFAIDRLNLLLPIAKEYPNDIIADGIVDCHDSPSGLVPWRMVWSEPEEAAPRKIDLAQFLSQKRPLIQPLFRKERALEIGACHGTRRNGEDLAFLLAFFAHGSVIRYLPKGTYLYRMTPNSLSTANPLRHKLYREMFEEARCLFDRDPRALSAIDEKILEVTKIEIYFSFYNAIRSAKIIAAWRLFKKNPWVGGELISRLVERIPYHMHRVFHGGIRRRIG
jgi:succinoglycan biosynthesis protein ExoO